MLPLAQPQLVGQLGNGLKFKALASVGASGKQESNPRSRKDLPNSPNIFVAAISQKIERAQITLDRGKVETQQKGENFDHHPHEGRAGAHPEDLRGKPGQEKKVTPERFTVWLPTGQQVSTRDNSQPSVSDDAVQSSQPDKPSR